MVRDHRPLHLQAFHHNQMTNGGVTRSGSASISNQDLRNGGRPSKALHWRDKRESNFREVRKKRETEVERERELGEMMYKERKNN
jgi:hypothetical protein